MRRSLRPALALIPARAGSKGVPGKNLRRLGGISLVALAVECARRARRFDRIVVSSDGEAILREARRAGAEALRRPHRLATDGSSVAETVAHALKALAAGGFKPRAVALIEPTCPLRTPALLARALDALASAEAAFTVSPIHARFHPAKQYRLDGGGRASAACPGLNPPVRRQELEPTCIRNGAAYAFRTAMFLRERSVLGRRPRAIVVQEPLVNIDTPEDLAEARRLWKARR